MTYKHDSLNLTIPFSTLKHLRIGGQSDIRYSRDKSIRD